jgi:hypothetical protein
MSDFGSELSALNQQQQLLEAKREIMLRKALTGDDPEALVKARYYFGNQMQKRTPAQKAEGKTFLTDPLETTATPGYRVDRRALNANFLRAMARTPYIRAIIGTRIEQVVDFAEPQVDKFSTGWVVRRRRSLAPGTPPPTEAQQKADARIVEEISALILNCGAAEKDANGADREWTKETGFEAFLRKFVKDSLELDAGCFEVIENRGGDIAEFYAVDGGTMYLADDYASDRYSDQEREQLLRDGLYPSTVQVLNGEVVAEYYPQELCYGVRNPSTELHRNGYGDPELVTLQQMLTNLLNSDAYNANFFKVGSMPRGILRVSGIMNQNVLEDFKQQWQSQVSGVINAHKVPTLNAEKADFINTHVPNKDMEFSAFHELQFRLCCVLFKMSPSEVGMEGTKGGSGNLQGEDKEAEVEYSKDKGLKPLLKFIAAKLNKYIIKRINPDFEFVFVGMDAETPEKELASADTRSKTNETINEVRASLGLKSLGPAGDIIRDSVFMQAVQLAQMGGEESNQAVDKMQDKPKPKASKKDIEKGNVLADNLNDWIERELLTA